MGIDYESERPKLSHRACEIYIIFSALNRRRIDHRPLQKNDIIEEIGSVNFKDICLNIIESLDSYWLKKESDRIRRQNGTR